MEWLDLSDSKNLITLIGAIVILAITVAIAGRLISKMKHSKADGQLTTEEWDGIREFTNDIPVGWAASYLVLAIWAIAYCAWIYPLQGFSQLGEYNEEVESFQAKLANKMPNASEADLQKMGGNFFLLQCAQCHGETGNGMNNRAADLTTWGTEEGIIDVVLNGSKGLNYPLGEMVPLKDTVSAEDAKAVAAFVMQDISSIGKTKYPELVNKGRAMFDEATCSACHGPDGKGMDGMGPDLSTYGDEAFLAEVFARGKKGHIGQMPSFREPMLSEIQRKALISYLKTIRE